MLIAVSREQMSTAVELFHEQCRRSPGVAHGLELDLEELGITEPLVVDVIPDGITWLAQITCGDRVFLKGAVEPKAFQDNLLHVLMTCVRALRTPATRAS